MLNQLFVALTLSDGAVSFAISTANTQCLKSLFLQLGKKCVVVNLRLEVEWSFSKVIFIELQYLEKDEWENE